MKDFLKKIYFITSLIFGFGLFLNIFDWQFYGYYTEKVIAWIWIFLTIIIIIIFWKNRNIKIYFFSLISLLILSLVAMMLPFFAMYNYLTNNGDYQQLKLNQNFRIERTSQQALSRPRVFIYENYFNILEQNICRPSYYEIVVEVLNIKNGYDVDLKSTPIQKIKFVKKNSDSIGIEYQILGKKKIVYHLLENQDGY